MWRGELLRRETDRPCELWQVFQSVSPHLSCGEAASAGNYAFVQKPEVRIELELKIK